MIYGLDYIYLHQLDFLLHSKDRRKYVAKEGNKMIHGTFTKIRKKQLYDTEGLNRLI